MAKLLDASIPNPIGERLADARSADDVTDLPTLEELRAAWTVVASHLDVELQAASASQLQEPSPQRFPVDDPSVAAGLAFLVHHESYHLGQIGLLRRQLGYGAMSYERRPRA
jgi:uncharacterized damage-inducible protein DinB